MYSAAACCPANTRKTGTVSSAPPKVPASSSLSWRRAAAPFALLALAASAAAIVMIDKPVTAAVEASEKVRHSKIVLLRLERVIVRRDAPAIWNVFWDMPEANAQTSVDDPHFLGYLTSLPNSASRDPKPVNFTLELPAAAVETLHQRGVMRFTFVPVRKLPEGGVTITALRLE